MMAMRLIILFVALSSILLQLIVSNNQNKAINEKITKEETVQLIENKVKHQFVSHYNSFKLLTDKSILKNSRLTEVSTYLNQIVSMNEYIKFSGIYTLNGKRVARSDISLNSEKHMVLVSKERKQGLNQLKNWFAVAYNNKHFNLFHIGLQGITVHFQDNKAVFARRVQVAGASYIVAASFDFNGLIADTNKREKNEFVILVKNKTKNKSNSLFFKALHLELVPIDLSFSEKIIADYEKVSVALNVLLAIGVVLIFFKSNKPVSKVTNIPVQNNNIDDEILNLYEVSYRDAHLLHSLHKSTQQYHKKKKIFDFLFKKNKEVEEVTSHRLDILKEKVKAAFNRVLQLEDHFKSSIDKLEKMSAQFESQLASFKNITAIKRSMEVQMLNLDLMNQRKLLSPEIESFVLKLDEQLHSFCKSVDFMSAESGSIESHIIEFKAMTKNQHKDQVNIKKIRQDIEVGIIEFEKKFKTQLLTLDKSLNFSEEYVEKMLMEFDKLPDYSEHIENHKKISKILQKIDVEIADNKKAS